MTDGGFAADVSGVAALAEPVRRQLYLYVAGRSDPVGRDEAAEGVGVPRHTAKFHLDKLVEEGLLDIEFRRLSGRRGPGAGRPSKLYRRSDRIISVSLPERRYDLAAQLMARAIDDAVRVGVGVIDSLHIAATEAGTELGQRAARAVDDDVVAAVAETLASQGYEPRVGGDTVTLANCPFDALAREHLDLVCGMNLALLGALAKQLDGGRLAARLDPAPGRCCVVLDRFEKARGNSVAREG